MPAVKLDGLTHQLFCGPPEGADEPRVERFYRYPDVGGHPVSVPIERCLECAAERVLTTLTRST